MLRTRMMQVVALSLWSLLAPAIPLAFAADSNLSDLLSFDGEPSIAVNPARPDNIIAGWMRLRVDGTIWIATRASFDGGDTWSPISFLPHTGPDYHSADVSIAFHRSGVAYLSYVDVEWSDTTAFVYVTKSTDGGLGWGTPVPVFSSSDRPDIPIDRPWIAVDNSGGRLDGTVFVTAMSLYSYAGGPHHVYLRTSSDGGVSWEPISQVDDSELPVGRLSISWGSVSVGGDGSAYIAYYSYEPSISPYLRAVVAVTGDGGSTFRRHVIHPVFVTAGADYTNGYSLAADPSTAGSAVLSWIDDRFGEADVVYSSTTDGGRSWSDPARINDDAEGNGVIQDRVWASFSMSGRLAVAWRDRRNGGQGSSVPADIYAAVSTGGEGGFGRNFRMSASSAPHEPLPCCNSFLGVAASGGLLYAVWGEDRSGDWEVRFNRLSISASPEVPSPRRPGGRVAP